MNAAAYHIKGDGFRVVCSGCVKAENKYIPAALLRDRGRIERVVTCDGVIHPGTLSRTEAESLAAAHNREQHPANPPKRYVAKENRETA